MLFFYSLQVLAVLSALILTHSTKMTDHLMDRSKYHNEWAVARSCSNKDVKINMVS